MIPPGRWSGAAAVTAAPRGSVQRVGDVAGARPGPGIRPGVGVDDLAAAVVVVLVLLAVGRVAVGLLAGVDLADLPRVQDLRCSPLPGLVDLAADLDREVGGVPAGEADVAREPVAVDERV